HAADGTGPVVSTEGVLGAAPHVDREASTAAAAEDAQPVSAEAPAIEIVPPPAPPSGVRPSDLRVIASADGAHPELPAERPSESPGDSPAPGMSSEAPAAVQPESPAPAKPP